MERLDYGVPAPGFTTVYPGSSGVDISAEVNLGPARKLQGRDDRHQLLGSRWARIPLEISPSIAWNNPTGCVDGDLAGRGLRITQRCPDALEAEIAIFTGSISQFGECRRSAASTKKIEGFFRLSRGLTGEQGVMSRAPTRHYPDALDDACCCAAVRAVPSRLREVDEAWRCWWNRRSAVARTRKGGFERQRERCKCWPRACGEISELYSAWKGRRQEKDKPAGERAVAARTRPRREKD